jgi:hypothetical protein
LAHHLHGALMISTVMGLLPPILTRLFNFYVPGLIISGPETLYRFGTADGRTVGTGVDPLRLSWWRTS